MVRPTDEVIMERENSVLTVTSPRFIGENDSTVTVETRNDAEESVIAEQLTARRDFATLFRSLMVTSHELYSKLTTRSIGE